MFKSATSTSLIAAIALAFGAAPALSQSTGGSPADPNTLENQQPGPSVKNPTDPAAGSNPAARVPTSPQGAAPDAGMEGAGAGDQGLESPAGIPADPNTNENIQPGPTTGNPSDPAAGSNPAARMPTEGTAD